MQNPRLAGRYAKSLIDLAKERGQLEDVFNDMQLLQRINKENPDFLALLRSPVIPSDKKLKVLEAVMTGKVTDLTAAFSKLLVAKGREASLPEIITAFIQQYKSFKHIHIVKLTTATPVSDSLKEALMAQVKGTSNINNIELETIVDDKIIGGFVLQTGDKLIDASVAYDLKQVSKQFENNDFIYKVR
jgi:F-type H+-transporting ATPase subunit delta